MGANATTFVPAYVSGEVLTAADLTVTNSGIPVFADSTARTAGFGGAGEKVLAEGQYAYLESDNSTSVYDGSNWVSVGTTPGMVLVGSASPTAVASVSINNCFTSTYENYRVVVAITAKTGGAGDVTMRLRVGGVDTSANYTYQLTENYGTTLTTSLNVVGTDEWYGTRIDLLGSAYSVDIYRPQTAQITAYNGQSIFRSGANLIQQITSGMQTDSTQFDGLTILFGSTSFTGTVRVYGYANS